MKNDGGKESAREASQWAIVAQCLQWNANENYTKKQMLMTVSEEQQEGWGV